jgi:hypothetical protein
VIRRRGARPCPFNNFRKKRSAARRFAPWLNEDVDHVTVLVDGPPKILQATVDVHEQFVQVRRVAQASLPVPQDTSVRRTEPLTPLPNRLVGHSDAPLSEAIFGIAEVKQKRWYSQTA